MNPTVEVVDAGTIDDLLKRHSRWSSAEIAEAMTAACPPEEFTERGILAFGRDIGITAFPLRWEDAVTLCACIDSRELPAVERLHVRDAVSRLIHAGESGIAWAVKLDHGNQLVTHSAPWRTGELLAVKPKGGSEE